MTLLEALNEQYRRLYEHYRRPAASLTTGMLLRAEQILLRRQTTPEELEAAVDDWLLQHPAAAPALDELIEGVSALRYERRTTAMRSAVVVEREEESPQIPATDDPAFRAKIARLLSLKSNGRHGQMERIMADEAAS